MPNSHSQPYRPAIPKVFISHSHSDRIYARELNKVLRDRGVGTFFDQEDIDIGDVLPDRIIQGIESCDTFLLLWSLTASRSDYVASEWKTAHGRRMKMFPYKLDDTPLPGQLNDIVYLDRQDRTRAHAGLLRAVFSPRPVPARPDEIFPGLWRATMYAKGIASASYELELRPNGQVTGSSTIDAGGLLADLMVNEGFGNLLNTRVKITGEWSYDDTTRSLTIEMNPNVGGRNNHNIVTVQMSGYESEAIQGHDRAERIWSVERIEDDQEKTGRALQSFLDDMRDKSARNDPDFAVMPLIFQAMCLGAAGVLGLSEAQVKDLVVVRDDKIDANPLINFLQEKGVVV